MFISHLSVKNWRNFRRAEARFREVTYIVGANATGKSNFLDVFRFLRDIARPQGGGFQKAIADRGGVTKIRCLHARSQPLVEINISIVDDLVEPSTIWEYHVSFKSENQGVRRPIIAAERVIKTERGREPNYILSRPDRRDAEDSELLTQTALEQIHSNADFRILAEFLSNITYLHLVPQLLKYGEFIGGRQLESDPFGQGFLARVSSVSEKVRQSRLRRIQRTLSSAIPQFEELRFQKDENGHPHLEAKYTHHRPLAGWQREDQFSDGTLRLIALCWLLLEGDSVLLLEEPELSLDEEIVRSLPRLIEKARKSTKRRSRQIIISTHSFAMLNNRGIDGRGVLRLERVHEGTIIHEASENELQEMMAGFTAADVILSKVHPANSMQMDLL